MTAVGDPGRFGWKRAAPSAVTLCGHALSLLWIAGALHWPWAIVGLGLDAVDGRLARRLGVASEFGALYDWTVDTTLMCLLCARLHSVLILVLIIPTTVFLRTRGHTHISGRFLATGVVLAREAFL
jgi:phosphatidylglycerophosphate synthase